MSITQDIRTAFQRRDNALIQFIIINVLVFAAINILRAVLTLYYGEDQLSYRATYELVQRQLVLSSSLPVLLRHPWTLLTYAFAHEDFFHILFNMVNLYWFGRLIREYLSNGNQRLVSLYVLGALAGGLTFLLTYNTLPGLQAAVGSTLIGASAAVVAIIIAAATLLPDYTFVLFFFGAVRIKYIAAVVILVGSVPLIFQGNPGGGLAHLGGALLGFVYVKQLNAGRDMGRPVQAIGSWLGSLFSRRPAMQVSHRTAASAARPAGKAAAPAEDVDAILDKISRSGYESLSKDEKQRLFRASQQ